MAARAAAMGIDPMMVLSHPAETYEVLRQVLQEAEGIYIERLEQVSRRIGIETINALAKSWKG